jgi:hypothetical protein
MWDCHHSTLGMVSCAIQCALCQLIAAQAKKQMLCSLMCQKLGVSRSRQGQGISTCRSYINIILHHHVAASYHTTLLLLLIVQAAARRTQPGTATHTHCICQHDSTSRKACTYIHQQSQDSSACQHRKIVGSPAVTICIPSSLGCNAPSEDNTMQPLACWQQLQCQAHAHVVHMWTRVQHTTQRLSLLPACCTRPMYRVLWGHDVASTPSPQ